MSSIDKSNREHSFDIELATIVGLEKAILLKNVSYWVKENQRRRTKSAFQGGLWWTEESLRSLESKYPYFRRASISRWLIELNSSGWVRMIGQSGGKNLYSLGEVYLCWNTGGDWENALKRVLSQNGTPSEVSQNGTPGVPKWDSEVSQNGTPGCPKMGHTNIDYIEYSYVENVECALAQKKPFGRKKSVDQFPPVPAAPPASRVPVLFVDSQVCKDGSASFRTALMGSGVSENVDTDYYFGRLDFWSRTKSAKSADWMATGLQFIEDDRRKEKLATIKIQNNDDGIDETTRKRLERAARYANRIHGKAS